MADKKKRCVTIITRAAWLLVLAIIVVDANILSFASPQNGRVDARPQVSKPFVPGRILVGFRPSVAPSRVRGLIAVAGARQQGEVPQIGVHILELPPGADEETIARTFRVQPEVEFAELDRLRPPDLTPNDPYYSKQWHLSKISGPTAWDSTTGSSSVIIAILDTGVDTSHPDLSWNAVPGWNFYDNNADTSDVYGHGTAVAGTAAAASDNSRGVASVAWNCSIMPVRISAPDGWATDSTIATGLTWAADQRARVANISYAVTNSSAVTSAAKYFQSKGGVVAVSAGNSSTADTSADNPYVLTVSATDSTDAVASFSNTGNNIDLAAPGVGIYTTNRGGGYGSWNGTSFSAPITAGIAALVISANPSLSAVEVQDILKQSADDLGTAGWDPVYGSGRVNATRAVAMALGSGGTSDTTPPTVNITSLAPGATVSGTITVQVSAGDDVGVSSVSLSIDGAALGSDTSAPYSFSWNTTVLGNGTHSMKATARDAAGNTATASLSLMVNNVGDTTPPTVSITSPADGARVSGTVYVLVSAADNTAVTKVELYVDGVLKTSSTAAPFTTKWNSRHESKGAHKLQCKAYDAARNAGASAVLTVYR